MKTTLVMFALLIATVSFAEENKVDGSQPIKPFEVIQTACNETGLTLLQRDELGQSGCCSWHGGVCGCQYGRVVCCDGNYSPSCSCRADDKPVEAGKHL